MREFAKQFREQVASVNDTSSPSIDLLDDILTPDGGPPADLEALMTALACLSGEIRDPAGELLIRNARSSERDLTRSLDKISDHLAEWTTIAPLTSGPFQVITKGAVYPISSTYLATASPLTLGASRFATRPLTASDLLLSAPPEPPAISRDRVDKHRASLSEARKTLEDWTNYFAGLRSAASELLNGLKANIQQTYSSYKARPAARSYKPLMNELLKRLSRVKKVRQFPG